jgi:threonine 3-dehydrogenase
MTDINDYRLDLATRMGASQTLNVTCANDSIDGVIANLGILPAPVEIDWNDVIFKGLNLQGIYGRKMFETWYKSVAMLQSGLDVSPVITHHFSIIEFKEAFDVMAFGQAGKVVLDWTDWK